MQTAKVIQLSDYIPRKLQRKAAARQRYCLYRCTDCQKEATFIEQVSYAVYCSDVAGPYCGAEMRPVEPKAEAK